MARRSLLFNESLDYKIHTVGISRATLAKTISAAVQSRKIGFNVPPAVFGAGTGSKAGSEISSLKEAR